MTSASFHVYAPAKLNLFLHITGRKPDGYHTLQSIFAFLNLGDDLLFEESNNFSLNITGPFANASLDPENNSVCRAAAHLASMLGTPLTGKVTLQKNIPIAAGMGGGSSDAAAALLGLTRLWGASGLFDNLAVLALDIGADVPACLHKKPSFVDGIGEGISPLSPLPDVYLVIVNPMIELPTASVFKTYAQKKNIYTPSIPPVSSFMNADQFIAFLKSTHNDLEETAINLCPSIADILRKIKKTHGCALARMTGSGATCFGIYTSEDTAIAAASDLTHMHPAWWIRTARWAD